ncbi:pnbA [Symbiodinium natans]|uniref:PnbA protein n=1 Tax=Symbiodinium natans TaxID=878477 RepID=A0A812IG97_9DINO|nr:pnbA [Symbiodinium natans]
MDRDKSPLGKPRVPKAKARSTSPGREGKSAFGRAPPARSGSSSDRRAFQALLQCQAKHMAKILVELDHGAKESCWAWYIFPTEKAGMCDMDETRITTENAKDLCDASVNTSAGHWQQCLEKICDLLEERNVKPPDSHVLPRIDHGRVHWFVKFWQSYEFSPPWMQEVCRRLDEFDFPRH